ncbi:unnamed protein product [Adineta steineri]|uniref:Isochorismatase-like domain-containing protein n=1 Tax=Adineta steineri TaxID=433720 RepID=A0A819WVJ6_9BILA|nr:unnamed protein product [Adineta steineri]CAF4130193.1 unnamed protein product [Adineta steineri]
MPSESTDPHDRVANNQNTALLLIDIINHFEFDDNEELLETIDEMGKHIASLKEAAYKAGMPIIYVNDNFGKWRSDFHTVTDYVIKENTRGKHLAELLLPNDEDYFILKPKHSGFYCTPLDILLNHLGIKTLILTGLAGNCCVLFTANDAYMRNFKLIIPKDCIGSNTRKENDQALKQMECILKADTRSSTEIIKEFKNMKPKKKTDDEKKSSEIIRK